MSRGTGEKTPRNAARRKRTMGKMSLRNRWRRARHPEWNDHAGIVRYKHGTPRVVWWLAVARMVRGTKGWHL